MNIPRSEFNYELRVMFNGGGYTVHSAFTETDVQSRCRQLLQGQNVKEVLVYRHEKFFHKRFVPEEAR